MKLTWKTEKRKVKDLKTWESNPRTIDESSFKDLKDSIEQDGDWGSLVIDLDGTVISGNQRLKAIDGEVDVKVPNRKLTEKEKRRIALRANRTKGKDNFDILANWDKEDLLEGWFDEKDLDKLLNLEPNEKDDTIPEHVEPIAKLGDIWQLGRHRVMCGDSTQPEAVLRLMEGKKADMVFTDPPYGMNLDTDYSVMVGIGGKVGNKFDRVKGDGADFTDTLITTVLDNFSYCKEIFMFGGDYYINVLPNYGKDGSWVVWDKQSNENDIGVGVNDSYGKMFGSNFELCWSKTKHKRVLCRVLWKSMFGMGKGDEKKRIHPTQKPVEVGCWFMKHFSGEESLVADLFLGSGSTLIACEKTNRICYGMELSEKYCDVIIKRWEDYTGKKAVKQL